MINKLLSDRLDICFIKVASVFINRGVPMLSSKKPLNRRLIYSKQQLKFFKSLDSLKSVREHFSSDNKNDESVRDPEENEIFILGYN